MNQERHRLARSVVGLKWARKQNLSARNLMAGVILITITLMFSLCQGSEVSHSRVGHKNVPALITNSTINIISPSDHGKQSRIQKDKHSLPDLIDLDDGEEEEEEEERVRLMPIMVANRSPSPVTVGYKPDSLDQSPTLIGPIKYKRAKQLDYIYPTVMVNKIRVVKVEGQTKPPTNAQLDRTIKGYYNYLTKYQKIPEVPTRAPRLTTETPGWHGISSSKKPVFPTPTQPINLAL